MRIAIVGTGVSGLICAYLLHKEHEITVFEAADYVGGHIHTHDLEIEGQSYAVDSGFIVFNEKTYPGFCRLLDRLGVESAPTSMSFSVRADAQRLEYGSRSVLSLFSEPRNLVRPRFHRMLRDIRRFHREALRLADFPEEKITLGEFVSERGYSRDFIDYHLIPMGASIWSATPAKMLEFPAYHFVRFLGNHGLLQLHDHLQWRYVSGGSKTYVEVLTKGFSDRIRVGCPVTEIRRSEIGPTVVTARHGAEEFDRVILATHSDQALQLLSDATPGEREILSAIEYQENEAVLHTDTSVMPKKRGAWCAWNYLVPDPPSEQLLVTYDMNRLQSIDCPQPLLVTLNPQGHVAAEHVLSRMTYHHPTFNTKAFAAQRLHDQIDGRNGTHFCGAYWGYGFHEDGLQSALSVCDKLGGGTL